MIRARSRSSSSRGENVGFFHGLREREPGTGEGPIPAPSIETWSSAAARVRGRGRGRGDGETAGGSLPDGCEAVRRNRSLPRHIPEAAGQLGGVETGVADQILEAEISGAVGEDLVELFRFRSERPASVRKRSSSPSREKKRRLDPAPTHRRSLSEMSASSQPGI